ncbi:MAG: G8 domain-containing protein [Bacteroidota bacterium]
MKVTQITSAERTFLFLPCLLLFCISNAQHPLPISSPLQLLPPSEATHIVQSSGNWSATTTWRNGAIPNTGAKIHIPAGTVLTIDGEITTRIKILRIDGKLQFSTTVNTSLNVETIIQGMSGELEIGTSSNPIPEGVSCTITIIDEGDIRLHTDQWEKGLVLMGKTVAYGMQKDSWATVAINPIAGETTLSLQNTPLGWQAGDRIVIAGTDPVDNASDEVATIASINGTTLHLSQPLVKNHSTPANEFKIHIANLSRNITIASENATENNGLDRGHIMFMHTLDVDFNYVRLYKMGRTRKDRPIDDWTLGEEDEFVNGARTNIRGRYSMHFHRGGIRPSLTPASVKGCVVEDDPGWAYASHSSYVHFDNNVSYNVIGGGFQTESGDELGSFTNNIAIRTVNSEYPVRFEAPENAPDTRESAQDFAFQGDGFWIHGGGVSVRGNIVSGASGHAFIYWPEGLIEPGFPSGTFRNTFKPENLGLPNSINIIEEEDVLATGWVSIAGFSNNIAYSSSIGLATYYLHTTFFSDIGDYDPNYIAAVHSTFDGFTAWNIARDGIQLHFTERVTLKNIRLVNTTNDTNSRGIWASHYRAMEKQVFDNVHIEGFGTGLLLPTQGKVTVRNSYLKNGINMYIPSVGLSYRDMLLEGLATEPDTNFNNPLDIQMEAFFTPPEDKYPAYFLLPDKIVLNYGNYQNQRLFFDEQAPEYTPLPVDAAPCTFFEETRYILPEFAGKNNQQLQKEYQMSFGGSLLPTDAVAVPEIMGGKIREWQNETLNVPVCVGFLKEIRFEEINACIQSAGNTKVAGPLPNYNHQTGMTDPDGSTSNPSENIDPSEPKEDLLVIYPNPTTGVISLSEAPDNFQVTAFTIDGRLVGTFLPIGNSVQIDISKLPIGLFVLQITDLDDGKKQVKKIIKLN